MVKLPFKSSGWLANGMRGRRSTRRRHSTLLPSSYLLLPCLLTTFVLLLALSCTAGAAPGVRGYYRYPALHGDTIIFTAHGDLYKTSTVGGLAQPMTTDPGEELSAAISPDGNRVAFMASYEGPTEVYVMPVSGGLPTRLTYAGEPDSVVGWTATGQILYATSKFSDLPNEQLIELNPQTMVTTPLPLSQAADGCFDRAGMLYFTRLPFQGSHTRRYKGGTAQNIWKWQPSAPEAVPLTADYSGTSKRPMWWNGRLYFVSDRDGFMNLWSMDPNGKHLRQLTHHAGLDLESPSLSDGRIVYQFGADLYLFTIATASDRLIDISLESDLDQTREKWIPKPMDYLSTVHLSPRGNRVVLTARGQVFVAPVQDGRLVEAARKAGVRYRSAMFAPDGKSVLVGSDQTGEVEWWQLPANGVGPGVRLSSGSNVLSVDGTVSPDGRYIAYGNKDQELWLLDCSSKTTNKLASSPEGEFSDFAWSPDSKWLAYVQPTALFSRVAIYSIASGRSTLVTTERSDAASPTWSPDGKWLYFLSDRTFHSLVGAPWGPREPEPFFDRKTGVYQIALTSGLRSPFARADELHSADDKTADKPNSKGAVSTPNPGKQPATNVTTELDGIASRIQQVPIPAGDYTRLSVSADRMFYLAAASAADPALSLYEVDIQNHDIASKALAADVTSYELSQDGKHILLRKGADLFVIASSAGAPASLDKQKVDLSGWSILLQPREEWRQMLLEAWRLERDYFYDRHMHGVDWPATLKRVMPLADRITDRAELSDLLGQMVSELSALHTFVGGGDMRHGTDHVQPALLGALLVRDPQLGGYRVSHIYQGDPDYPTELSPLVKPGVDVVEGDTITMVNGTPLLSAPELGALLRNQARKQVLIHIKSASGHERDAVVTPMTTEAFDNLRYDAWEFTRRQIVENAGGGQIGYVHPRAMGGADIAQWAKDFYPVFNRQGLIIDVRNNQGGNIDSWILEKLLRRAWFYWQPRVGNPTWNMQWAFRGHIVLICNELTMSDGEAFSEGFRRLGLGKIIGTRTWGGEIWLSFDNRLVDNGIASAAETGVYSPEGQWLIEGHGVDPDIVVGNLPHATFNGTDAQLQAAIALLQKEIKERPVPVTPTPTYPNKAFKSR